MICGCNQNVAFDPAEASKDISKDLRLCALCLRHFIFYVLKLLNHKSIEEKKKKDIE